MRRLAVAAEGEEPEARGIADEIFSEMQAKEIEGFLAAMQDGLLLASSNEAAQVEVRRAQFLPVAYPVLDHLRLTDAPLMGLRGSRFIEEQLWNGSIWRRQWRS